jgi:hypothetical protein
MIADYPEVSKAEMRYGTFPVHNKKFNQLIQYLEKVNKQLQVPNPTKKQIGLQDAINSQLNMERLKILTDDMKKKKDPTIIDKALVALRFRDFCGLNTQLFQNIYKDLDDPDKMFEIDRICLMHDINYSKAKTKEDIAKADDIMLAEIRKKYIYTFEENFVTGNYDMDFSNWSSSLATFGNSALSLLQGIFNVGYVITGTAMPIFAGYTGYKISKYYRDQYNQRRTPRNYIPRLEDAFSPFETRLTRKENAIFALGNMLAITPFLRDRFLAIGSMFAITLKKGVETFLGVDIVKPTEHEVSEEQLGEIIRVFELLQNEYLTDSDLQPIKIGRQWENEEIEMPTIKQLNEEIGEIIKTNQTYFEKVITLPIETIETIEEEEEQPVDEEIYTNPYFANHMELLSEQRERLNKLLSMLTDELFNQPTDENSLEENIDENIDVKIEENKQEL